MKVEPPRRVCLPLLLLLLLSGCRSYARRPSFRLPVRYLDAKRTEKGRTHPSVTLRCFDTRDTRFIFFHLFELVKGLRNFGCSSTECLAYISHWSISMGAEFINKSIYQAKFEKESRWSSNGEFSLSMGARTVIAYLENAQSTHVKSKIYAWRDI